MHLSEDIFSVLDEIFEFSFLKFFLFSIFLFENSLLTSLTVSNFPFWISNSFLFLNLLFETEEIWLSFNKSFKETSYSFNISKLLFFSLSFNWNDSLLWIKFENSLFWLI